METLIHTAEGELRPKKKIKLELDNYPNWYKLKDIPLDNEEELLAPWQHLLNRQAQALRPMRTERYKETILNFYRRLKKLECVEVRHLYYRNGYFRALVRYPNGRHRRWWSSGWFSTWHTSS